MPARQTGAAGQDRRAGPGGSAPRAASLSNRSSGRRCVRQTLRHCVRRCCRRVRGSGRAAGGLSLRAARFAVSAERHPRQAIRPIWRSRGPGIRCARPVSGVAPARMSARDPIPESRRPPTVLPHPATRPRPGARPPARAGPAERLGLGIRSGRPTVRVLGAYAQRDVVESCCGHFATFLRKALQFCILWRCSL